MIAISTINKKIDLRESFVIGEVMIMGRKAKIKKMRQPKNVTAKPNQKYDSTEFVEQFARMGYQLQSNQPQPSANRGNISPEIPQERIEPQL